VGRASRRELRIEVERAHISVSALLPPKRFYQFVGAIDQCCAPDQDSSLRREYLNALQESGIPISESVSISLVPTAAFAGAYSRGESFVTNVSEELGKLGGRLGDLLRAYLQSKAERLREQPALCSKYPIALRRADVVRE
jgi:hypothetical protein